MPWEMVGLKTESWEVRYNKLVRRELGTCPFKAIVTCFSPALGRSTKEHSGTVPSRTGLRETIFDTKWLCDPVQVTRPLRLCHLTSEMRGCHNQRLPQSPSHGFLHLPLASSGAGFRHKWGGYFTRGNWTECDLLSLEREKLRPFGDLEEATLGVHSPSAVSPSPSGKLPPVQMALWVVWSSAVLLVSRQTHQRCVSSSSSRSSLVRLSRGTIQLSPSSPFRLTTFFSCISEGVSITSKVGLSW